MTSKITPPTTIGGIKRRAAEVKQQHEMSYMKALDIAAQMAGFQNYKDAKRSIELRNAQYRYPVTLSEHWYDRTTLESGNETLTFDLSQPIAELVKPHQLRGRMSGLRMVDNVCLKSRANPSSDQAMARWYACRTARTLQFMETTGLKPTDSLRAYPKSDWENRPYGADHDCQWYDPESRRYVLTDEPYPKSSPDTERKRAQWAEEHGYCIVQSRWFGIHNVITELYLIAKRADRAWIEALVQKLESSRAPLSEENWSSLNTSSDSFRLPRLALAG